MTPELQRIDHIHVFVTDRVAAQAWYARVMGLQRIAELVFWSTGGGPLTIGNAGGSVHVALFEGPSQRCRSTVAFGVAGAEFLAWRSHLEDVLERRIEPVDHQVSWSLYFADPDGNPFEITSNDHELVSTRLREGIKSTL
jgi:catechol-2,3-dioxygenase